MSNPSEPDPAAPTRNRTVRYAEWLIRRRWLVLLASLLAVIALTAGAPRLTFNVEYSVWFSDQNPELLAFCNNERL